MIVCICANVNTAAIEQAASVCGCIDHIRATTGACQVCQLCKTEIEDIIKESTNERTSQGSVV